MARSQEFLFDTPLNDTDSEIGSLIEAESGRQDGKLILIASESLCPRPVREALVSAYSAIYAEGYPSTRMMHWERNIVQDRDRHLAFNRRYADRRYYKGCEYTNFVEVLAQKRAAEVFAANGVRKDDIYVNVQPLSGSAANNAIYTAFVQPGDLVMGMALPHGGHLTHGSHLNRSGKFYRIHPYLVDEQTGRLDYDAIKDACREHQPRLLIAGASAYPWEFDWPALREAADQVGERGCLLLADMSHPSGLIAAGEFSSPVGYADVVSMTTHKTMCGPRGAIILTTDRDLADQIDLGVFPGEQGGPHINQVAAKAVAFGLAQTDTFKQLMGRVRSNADALCAALIDRGVRIQGGGTKSHLFLIDLKGTKKPSGIPLYGDIAANILDLCNITTNKNTIIGDASAAHPTGLRVGTTVLSQQGYDESDMRTLADLICKVVDGCQTFTVTTGGGVRGRARIDRDVMEEVKAGVAALTGDTPPDTLPANEGPLEIKRPAGAVEVRGERSAVFLQCILTTNVMGMRPGDEHRSFVLDREGRVFLEVEIQREKDQEGFPSWNVVTAPAGVPALESWLRGLSDGYLHFDDDLTRKVDGPVALRRDLNSLPRTNGPFEVFLDQAERPPATERLASAPDRFDLTKPWFVGRHVLDEGREITAEAPPYRWTPAEANGLRKTSMNALHQDLTKAHNLVPFAGWEMPVLYTSILEEHRAVRTTGGLFDLAHMGTMEVIGPGATRFLDLVTSNFVWKLRPGQSHYTYILKPDGTVMDDLLVYMLGQERFLVVANACNADEVLEWLRLTASGEARLSRERPDLAIDVRPIVRDLKDPDEGGDAQRVDLGFQGPKTRDALLAFASVNPEAERAIAGLRKNELAEVTIGDFELVVSRTGYTGEEVGFEIFVHPDLAGSLWTRLLEIGADQGIVPTGLGARDSLRAEAGFPLYGHELAGDLDILPGEAGYAAFIKEHKPFFVGRDPHLARARTSKRQIARLRFEHSGIRMFQPGDPVVNGRGKIVGAITSTILPGNRQLALALVDLPSARPGNRLGAFLRPRKPAANGQKPIHELSPGDMVAVPEPALVLDRFQKVCGEDESSGLG